MMHPVELTAQVRLSSGEVCRVMGRAFVGTRYHYDFRMEDGGYRNNEPADAVVSVIGDPYPDIIRG